MREKERELNERLQDVTGKLGSAKKVHRKGSLTSCYGNPIEKKESYFNSLFFFFRVCWFACRRSQGNW